MSLPDGPYKSLPVRRVLGDRLTEVVILPHHIIDCQVQMVACDGASNGVAALLDRRDCVRGSGVLQNDPELRETGVDVLSTHTRMSGQGSAWLRFGFFPDQGGIVTLRNAMNLRSAFRTQMLSASEDGTSPWRLRMRPSSSIAAKIG